MNQWASNETKEEIVYKCIAFNLQSFHFRWPSKELGSLSLCKPSIDWYRRQVGSFANFPDRQKSAHPAHFSWLVISITVINCAQLMLAVHLVKLLAQATMCWNLL